MIQTFSRVWDEKGKAGSLNFGVLDEKFKRIFSYI